MDTFLATPRPSGLVHTRDIAQPNERAEFFNEIRRARFAKIFRGIYMESGVWDSADVDLQYLSKVKAVAERDRTDDVFSHQSAAALWQLPWIDGWPEKVHVTGKRAEGGRSNKSVFRHVTGVPEQFEVIEGLAVTTLSRTVVDLARRCTFRQAVVVADAALRRTDHPIHELPSTSLNREELLGELQNIPPRQGVRKARAVIEFADGSADRPGESLSRVGMRAAGLPIPQLQARITGASGKTWTVDFYWPEFGLAGEFDGRVKYKDPEFLRGRSPEQALADEKEREDDIRATGIRVSRWGWELALSPMLLRHHLILAGLAV